MKTLTYSIQINAPKDHVFKTIIDKSVFPEWAKAWGEGMTFEGEWKVGSHVAFFDQTQGGTKVVIEADEAFEEMMNSWHKALEYFKAICERD